MVPTSIPGTGEPARRLRTAALACPLCCLAATAGWAGSFDKEIAELDVQIIYVVPRDAIPAMTNPALLTPDQATFRGDVDDPLAYVEDDDRVLGVVRNGVARAYPLNLGWWHEVINDSLGGDFVSVTYCPLTGTGMVFDVADKQGRQGELSVSGTLLNGNLVLFDRRDGRSIYPQMTYTGLTGEYKGIALDLLPVVETTWGLWKRLHPDTRVPAAGSGLARYSDRVRDAYSRIRLYREAENGYPYGDYRTDDLLYYPVTTAQPDLRRYRPKETVLGLCQDGRAKAYAFRDLGARRVVNDRVGSRDLVVLYEPASQTAIPYDRRLGDRLLTFHLVEDSAVDTPLAFGDVETGSRWNLLGEAVSGPLAGERLQQVPAHNAMWFAWSVFWPDTGVWAGEGVHVPTAVADAGAETPGAFWLAPNAPNPFNAATRIEYGLPQPGRVSLAVYDIAGQRVRVLRRGPQAAGRHALSWDGRDDAGRPVASGVYRYRLQLPDRGLERSRAMTLLR